MEKFFPPKPPMELIATPAVGKLLTLLGQNGYPNAAILLIVHDMDTSETTIAGNLNDVGTHALLMSAVQKVGNPENEGPSSPAPNGDKLN